MAKTAAKLWLVSSLASSTRQCARHARLRRRLEPTQADWLKRRVRDGCILYLHHAPECVHTVHAGERRAPAEPEVRARLRTARHVAPDYHCAHVFRAIGACARGTSPPPPRTRADGARARGRTAVVGQFAHEPRAVFFGRATSMPPAVHFNTEAPEEHSARTRSRRPSGGCTSGAPSPPSSCVVSKSTAQMPFSRPQYVSICMASAMPERRSKPDTSVNEKSIAACHIDLHAIPKPHHRGREPYRRLLPGGHSLERGALERHLVSSEILYSPLTTWGNAVRRPPKSLLSSI